MDNLIFEKIWIDEGFFEVKITAISKSKLSDEEIIKIINNIYISNQEIVNFYEKLSMFLEKKCNEFTWKNFSEPNIYLHLFYNDNLGHVTVEIYMKLDGEEFVNEKYNCYFPIKTEIGLLDNFANGLKNFNTSDVGYTVKLVD